MKKIFKILFCFLILLVFSVVKDVFAADQWPKNIAVGDFVVDVEGIDVRIYSTEEVTETKETDGYSSTVTYTKNTLFKTINLSFEDYVVNPTVKPLPGSNGSIIYYVDLNLAITKEQVQNLIEQHITEISDEKYFVDLAVNYKVSKYPDKYLYVYNYDVYEALIGSFNDDYIMPLVDLTKANTLVINRAAYYKEEGKIIFDYSEKVTDENTLSLYLSVVNYIAFSEEEVKSTEETSEKIVGLMFGTINRLDLLLSSGDEDENEDDSSGIGGPIVDDSGVVAPDVPSVENGKIEQIVKVEDTAMPFPMPIFVVGVMCLLFGGLVFYKAMQIN